MIDKDIVIPGDLLSDDPRKSGKGTYVEDGKVFALTYGVLESKDRIKVIPLGGKYLPYPGDSVIGIVTDFRSSSWSVDINAPYNADLFMSEYPERINFGDMGKHLRIGDSIVTKIIRVDEEMRIDLTLKEPGLRVLRGGRIINFFHSKIPRLIGRSGSMINMIKEECQCALFVGQNGRIWISGEDDNIALAIKTIKKIEDEAHTSGLTAKIAQYLEDERKGIENE